MKTGVLLVNLGSPDEPKPAAVGRYLKQFLMDPYVIDLPWALRALLVQGIIVPFRKHKSAEAYSKVWTEAGSPLVGHTRNLVQPVAESLGNDFVVDFGMRYGNPSIEAGLTNLKYAGVDTYHVIPLYPQYAASSTETAVAETMRAAESLKIAKHIRILPPFFEHDSYIDALTLSCAREVKSFAPEHILFSFHGLPIRAIRKTCSVSQSCIDTAGPCSKVGIGNQNCYRAHCYSTMNAVVEKLGLQAGSYSIGFQSRLSKNWIQPFSDTIWENLARSGVKKLLVACPSFVADCLETLEEIGIRANYDFRRFGGQELRLVPSLNTDPVWVKALTQVLLDKKK